MEQFDIEIWKMIVEEKKEAELRLRLTVDSVLHKIISFWQEQLDHQRDSSEARHSSDLGALNINGY